MELYIIKVTFAKTQYTRDLISIILILVVYTTNICRCTILIFVRPAMSFRTSQLTFTRRDHSKASSVFRRQGVGLGMLWRWTQFHEMKKMGVPSVTDVNYHTLYF